MLRTQQHLKAEIDLSDDTFLCDRNPDIRYFHLGILQIYKWNFLTTTRQMVHPKRKPCQVAFMFYNMAPNKGLDKGSYKALCKLYGKCLIKVYGKPFNKASGKTSCSVSRGIKNSNNRNYTALRRNRS